MKLPLTVAWIALLAVAPAHAFDVPLGDGAPWRAERTEADPGTLLLTPPPGAAGRAGSVALTTPAPAAAAAAAASVVAGPDGKRLVRVVFTETDGRTFEALLTLAGTPPAPAAVWSGWTTPAGDPGERVGAGLQVEDLDGDGVPEVLVGRTFEASGVCGQSAAPLLHRRAYDWSSGRLRPVSLARAGLDPARAIVVEAAAAPPAAAGRLPLLEYRGASSALGDGENPLQISPPRGLEDLNGRTGWAEGVGGSGKLEFVTARVAAGLEGRWLAVRATDDGDVEAPRTRNRPKTLLLVDGGGQAWRLELPDDAAARAGALLWFELPAAVAGGCLTAAILDTHPATAAAGRRSDVTWISDLQLFALVSSTTDPEVVRPLLENDASAAAGEALLRSLGAEALPLLERLAPTLSAMGAVRAATFLAGRDEPAAARAALALAPCGKPAVRDALQRTLETRGAGAGPFLTALFEAEVPGGCELGPELLGELGGPETLAVLIAGLERAEEARRPVLRAALGALLRRLPGQAGDVLVAARVALEEGRETAVADLVRAVGVAPAETRDAQSMLVREALGSVGDFGARFHLVRTAGELLRAGDTAEALALVTAARGAPEAELRAEATRQLAAAPELVDLTPMLADPWPGVRVAAAWAVGRRRVPAELQALARRFAEESWPLVRAEAAGAFLAAGEWPGDDVVERLLADRARPVRERVVAALEGRTEERAGALLARLVEDREETLGVRQRALGALAQRCWPELKPLVIRVVEWSVRGESSPGDQELAVDAIGVLGTAAPAGARRLLEEIAREAPYPSILAAALTALAELGEADARGVIEPQQRHPDPLVGDAARAALRRLEQGRAGRRCDGVEPEHPAPPPERPEDLLEP